MIDQECYDYCKGERIYNQCREELLLMLENCGRAVVGT